MVSQSARRLNPLQPESTIFLGFKKGNVERPNMKRKKEQS
jgi:hypothetical protein